MLKFAKVFSHTDFDSKRLQMQKYDQVLNEHSLSPTSNGYVSNGNPENNLNKEKCFQANIDNLEASLACSEMCLLCHAIVFYIAISPFQIDNLVWLSW